MTDDYRVEHDSMGEVRVPRDARWQAQTQRAVENFPISGQPLEPALIHALARIKAAAAHTNAELGSLTTEQADAITRAADEIVDGQHDDQFPIDVFQTGSGTSTNMNVNEVIATLAHQQGVDVHPNDHVNAAQSSNDTFPSAIHVAAVLGARDLLAGIATLHAALQRQERRVRRRGEVRAHPPDGRHTGDPRAGAGRVRRRGRPRARASRGGPPPGPGAPPGRHGRRHRHQRARRRSPRKTIDRLNEATGERFTEARDHFEAQGGRDAIVELSGALRTYAVGLVKICNDLRWMASGPTTGLAEIHLKDLQPGSSIMPGKVNPVIPEATLMVCAQVIGNDAAIAFAGASGTFELNVMLPVIARNVLESERLLASVSRLLATCVDGITADRERMRRYAESSPSVVTPLNKYLGYEEAAKVAKRALADGRTIRDTVVALGYVEQGRITEAQLDEALDIESMTRSGE